MLETVVAFAVGLVLLGLIIKVLSLPFKLVWKLLTNSLLGAVILWGLKVLGVPVAINFLSALVTGIVVGTLGIPGVVLVLIYTYWGM